MKKSFVINSPRPGRSTATLVTHVYNHDTKRTQTIYIGSLPIDLDPDSIPVDACIPSGGHLHGIRVSSRVQGLEPDDLAVIRQWLELHGVHRRRQAMERAWASEASERKRIEREQLRLQIELELRSRIEQEVRTTLEAELRAKEISSAPEAALDALQLAGKYFVEQSEVLRADGLRVSNIRCAAVTTASGANPLDALQATANRIRIGALAQFENDCKAAGIMAGRTGRRASPSPSQQNGSGPKSAPNQSSLAA
jgi:hypothetical protein